MKRKQRKRVRRTVNFMVGTAIVAIVCAAIADQLRRPPEERTWQGEVAGIPYNFRLPKVEGLLKSFWNEESNEILTPRQFGVGWDLNLYPILHR